LRDSQKEFYSLNLDPEKFTPNVDETNNLFHLRIKEAINDAALKKVASTFDYHDNIVRDGIYDSGKVIVTFSSILRHSSFPLANILKTLLETGKKEMNIDVEIEFAANLNVPKGAKQAFYFLQIRPIVATSEKQSVKVDTENVEKSIITCFKALGNGLVDNIRDIVYVKPQTFNPSRTNEIAIIVEKINKQFVESGKNYVLVGPGRWGSADPWLGVPVKWAQISAARLIVESGLKDFQIDPSQGTHFFQNLTSFNVGYFTINPFNKDGFYDVDYLDSIPAVYEDEFLRHVRFEKSFEIKIDGKKNIGTVGKPMNQ
jgi:hypothetical protein